MSFDKNTGKILKKTDANGIESSYSYDDGGKDGEQNGWVNEYLVRKIKTEVDYQELDAAGLVKFLKTNKEKKKHLRSPVLSTMKTMMSSLRPKKTEI